MVKGQWDVICEVRSLEEDLLIESLYSVGMQIWKEKTLTILYTGSDSEEYDAITDIARRYEPLLDLDFRKAESDDHSMLLREVVKSLNGEYVSFLTPGVVLYHEFAGMIETLTNENCTMAYGLSVDSYPALCGSYEYIEKKIHHPDKGFNRLTFLADPTEFRSYSYVVPRESISFHGVTKTKSNSMTELVWEAIMGAVLSGELDVKNVTSYVAEYRKTENQKQIMDVDQQQACLEGLENRNCAIPTAEIQKHLDNYRSLSDIARSKRLRFINSIYKNPVIVFLRKLAR